MLQIFTFHTTKKPKLALSEFLSLTLCLFVCKKAFGQIFVRFSREPVSRTNHLSTSSDGFWYRPITSNYWYWTHCERWLSSGAGPGQCRRKCTCTVRCLLASLAAGTVSCCPAQSSPSYDPCVSSRLTGDCVYPHPPCSPDLSTAASGCPPRPPGTLESARHPLRWQRRALHISIKIHDV